MRLIRNIGELFVPHVVSAPVVNDVPLSSLRDAWLLIEERAASSPVRDGRNVEERLRRSGLVAVGVRHGAPLQAGRDVGHRVAVERHRRRLARSPLRRAAAHEATGAGDPRGTAGALARGGHRRGASLLLAASRVLGVRDALGTGRGEGLDAAADARAQERGREEAMARRLRAGPLPGAAGAGHVQPQARVRRAAAGAHPHRPRRALLRPAGLRHLSPRRPRRDSGRHRDRAEASRLHAEGGQERPGLRQVPGAAGERRGGEPGVALQGAQKAQGGGHDRQWTGHASWLPLRPRRSHRPGDPGRSRRLSPPEGTPSQARPSELLRPHHREHPGKAQGAQTLRRGTGETKTRDPEPAPAGRVAPQEARGRGVEGRPHRYRPRRARANEKRVRADGDRQPQLEVEADVSPPPALQGRRPRAAGDDGGRLRLRRQVRRRGHQPGEVHSPLRDAHRRLLLGARPARVVRHRPLHHRHRFPAEECHRPRRRGDRGGGDEAVDGQLPRVPPRRVSVKEHVLRRARVARAFCALCRRRTTGG